MINAEKKIHKLTFLLRNTKFLLAAVMLISVSLSSVLSEEKRGSKLQIRSSRPMKRFKPTQLSTDVSQVDEREEVSDERE